jgi:ketosteroid isomerase-like protein
MSRQEEIRRLYAAFNRRDIDSVLERHADDVVWANGWEGGHVRGRAAVRDYWSRQLAAIRRTWSPRRSRSPTTAASRCWCTRSCGPRPANCSPTSA